MSNKSHHHTDIDWIIRAIIDESELSDSMREHLGHCVQCRTEKERLQQDLARLGRMAERFAALPQKQLTLTDVKVQRTVQWFWRWQTALGAAMAVAVIILMLWTIPDKSTNQGPVDADILTQETWGVEAAMLEIDSLSENMLPQIYLDISGEIEPDFYEEFMEFVFPLMNSNTLTLFMGMKGVIRPC